MPTHKSNEPVVPAQDPLEPSAARKKFLAGEITWREYVEAEKE